MFSEAGAREYGESSWTIWRQRLWQYSEESINKLVIYSVSIDKHTIYIPN